MNYPLISIMIPTYGQERYVAQAIRSALSQDYPNIDVLVTDDASPDATFSVVAPFRADPRFRYIRRPVNLGRVRNYRATLADARGEWCLNLDGDDYMTNPGYISAAMRMALSDPDIVMVFGNATIGWGDDPTGLPMIDEFPETRVMTGKDFLLRHPPFLNISPAHLAALYRRDVALAANFYSLDIISSDSDGVYRIGVGHKVALIEDMAGVWRQHGGNASHTSPIALSESDWLRARSIEAWCAKSGEFSPRELRDLKRKLVAGCGLADTNHLRLMGAMHKLPVLIGKLAREDALAVPLYAWWLVGKTARFFWRRRRRIPAALYRRLIWITRRSATLRSIWHKRVPEPVRRRLAA